MPKLSASQMQQRKDHILHHAFQLFSEQGYSDTSMDDIVQATGMSKGGVYTYFKSKEDIFLEIAEVRLIQRKNVLDQFPDGLSAAEKLALYISTFLAWIIDKKNIQLIRFTLEFWSVMSRNPDMKERSRYRYERISADLEQIVAEGKQSGQFRTDVSTEVLSFFILSAMDGVGFVTGVMGVRTDAEIIELTKNMVLNYVMMGEDE